MADVAAEVADEGPEAAVVAYEALEVGAMVIEVEDLTVLPVVLTTAANGSEVAVGFQNT